MKVLVLGAGGFIGRPVVRALRALGEEVLAVSRNLPPAASEAGVERLALDRRDPIAVAEAASRRQADVVVDLIAYAEADTVPLLDALAGRIGRYALISSADVYRRYGALHRKEWDEAGDASLDEDAPLRTRLYPYRAEPRRDADDPLAWMDDYDKIPIERALAARPELGGVVLRLPMVYGPGDRQRRFAWAIGPMLKGRPVIEIDAAWAAWRTSYGYVDDVAAGIAVAATHPAATGAYNLGPQDFPTQMDWARRFAVELGWRGELRTQAHAQGAPGRFDGLDLTRHLTIDSRRIRRDLGFAEPTDPGNAVRRTLEDEADRQS